MFAVVITEKGGAQRKMEFDKHEVTIGRVQGNDIILPKGNVSKRHSRVVLKDNRFIVVDLKSTNGTYVNGRKITSPLVVKPGDKVYIGDFILTVEEMAQQQAGFAPPRPSGGPPPLRPQSEQNQPAPPAPAPQPPAPAPQPVAMQPAPQPSAPAPAPQPVAPAPAPQPVAQVPQPAPQPVAPPAPAPAPPAPAPAPAPPPAPTPPPAAPTPPPAAPSFDLGREPEEPKPARRASRPPPSMSPPPIAEPDGMGALMARVAGHFDTSDTTSSGQDDPGRLADAQKVIEESLRKLIASGAIQDDPSMAKLALREAVGLGVLEALLADPEVTDIRIEGANRIMANRGDGLEQVDAKYSSNAMLSTVARRLLARGGSQANGAFGQTTLTGGETVLVVLPPVAVGGPIIEVRRGIAPKGEALVARGTLDGAILNTLSQAIGARKNVAVVGPVGATGDLIAALVGFTDDDERVVAIGASDVAISRPHVSLGASQDMGLGAVARRGAHLRGDRFVVNGAGLADLFDVLAAASSRGGGCILGVDAAADDDATAALRLGARLGRTFDDATVSAFVFSAVDVVVQVDQTVDGPRVREVAELSGADTKTLHRWDGSAFKTENSPSFE